MRTIYGLCVLVSLGLICPPFADAKETAGNLFSVTPLSGLLWGRGEEIVRHQNPPANNNSSYMSRILWDFKPLVFFGIEMNYAPRTYHRDNGFYGTLSFKAGLPLKTGIMENSDWLSTDNGFLTHYSRHDAYSRSSLTDLFSGYGTFAVSFSAGYSWAFFDRLWLRPYAELSYLRFSWKSRDGYTQYGGNTAGPGSGSGNYDAYDPWEPDFPKEPWQGKAQNYSQNWVLFAPAIALGITLSDFFSLSLFAAWTPLVYGACRDEHLHPSKKYVFLDYLSGGWYVHQGAKLDFTLGRAVTLSLSTALLDLNGASGDTYTSMFGGPFFFSPGTAGGGFSFSEFTLLVQIAL